MAKYGSYLEAAEDEMEELVAEASKAERGLQQETSQLRKDNQELSGKIKKLEEECDNLERKAIEIEKLTNSSSDARKMYGDITPGDTTHQDVILLYQNHFKEAFRNLPKRLEVPKKEKYEVWGMTAQIVEDSFEQCKEHILTKMISELERVLLDPRSSDPMDSKTSDFYRAFKIFIEEKQKQGELDKIQQEILQEDQHTVPSFVELVMDIITQLDPDDYLSFIGKEEKHTRTYPRATKPADTSRTKVKEKNKKRCAACKKAFTASEMPTYHMGLYWHQVHCYCVRCHRMIDEGFQSYNKYIYCSQCLCKACHKPLDDEGIDTGDGLFHRKCLECAYCHTIKKDMMIVNGYYLCKKCFEQYGYQQNYI